MSVGTHSVAPFSAARCSASPGRAGGGSSPVFSARLNKLLLRPTWQQTQSRSVSLASSSQELTRRAPSEAGCDIVQFSAAIFYAAEAEGAVVVDVMRLGSLQGDVCVSWQTCAGSAAEGVVYKAATGKLMFRAGEHLQTLEIALIRDEAWEATLEFKIILSEPHNCELGAFLHIARVKVISDDVFPTNKYAASILKGPKGIEKIPTLSLLLEYLKMHMNIPRVPRMTVIYLILDQMANFYFYFTVNVTSYITDVLFAESPKSVSLLPGVPSSMFVPGNPEMSAMCLAVLYSLPMAPIHFWDYAYQWIDLKGTLKHYLRANLYRKYLNYTADSRSIVQMAEMQTALSGDVVEASQCYTYVVDLLRIISRLLIIISITLQQNPQSWWILVLMPTLMLCWIYLRGPVYLQACDADGDYRLQRDKFIHMTCYSCDFIADYRTRSKMVAHFEKELQESTRHGRIPKQQIEMNNTYFPKWLGSISVGLYMSIASKQVLGGGLSVGEFLATMQVLGSIAGTFGEAYHQLMSLQVVIGTLRGIVHMFNMPIDVRTEGVRREMTNRARACVKQSSSTWTAEDLIPLEVVNMGLTFSSGVTLVSKVSLTVPQGSMIAVRQVNRVKGRSTLLKLLGQVMRPTEGHIFVPDHLRVLHVSHQPLMLGAGLWFNLTFGLQDSPRDRVEGILSDLDMPASLKYLAESQDENSQGWQRSFSGSELALVHLARAFVKSAEVTVFNRPLAHLSFPNTQRHVMRMMRELVDSRGVRLPAETLHRRRPRTCFFTPETEAGANQADFVWTIESDRSISVREIRAQRATPASS